MGLDEGQKALIVTLCIAIAVGSVFGIIAGIVLTAFTGEGGYIALIVVSGLAFVGAIFGIYYVLIGKKSEMEEGKERKKRTTKETLVWVAATLLTGTIAFLFYFLGMKIWWAPFRVMMPFIVIFGAACLFSLIVLISGRSIRKENHVDTRTSSE